ncbi:MAG: tRNA lysidine(34) synthetase TilS [Spirochaetota bacterium]
MNNSNNFLNKSREFISSARLLRKGDRVLLSLSAGKDSMALLHLMDILREEYALELGIFHLNHKTRGADSDADEDFLRECAKMLGIPMYCRQHDFSLHQPAGMSFEDYARTIRYRMLSSIAADENYSRVCTAHNSDDQVETILMRILTGTGLHGLSGISPSRDIIIRPILWATADEVYSYLENNGIQWREDKSNAENHYLRNFIRNRVLPLACSRIPSTRDAILALRENASEQQQLLQQMVERCYPDLVSSGDGEIIIRYGPMGENRPLFTHVCARQIRVSFHQFVNRRMLLELYRKAHASRGHAELYNANGIRVMKSRRGGEWVLVLSRNIIYQAPGEWEYPVSPIRDNLCNLGEIAIDLDIRFVNYSEFESRVRKPGCVFVDAGSAENILIRNRRDGDRITLEEGTRKIKKLFIDLKLSPDEKQEVPIIVIDGEIACCMLSVTGKGDDRVAKKFKVTRDSKKILAICTITS